MKQYRHENVADNGLQRKRRFARPESYRNTVNTKRLVPLLPLSPTFFMVPSYIKIFGRKTFTYNFTKNVSACFHKKVSEKPDGHPHVYVRIMKIY